MNEATLPPSPNWYFGKILSCSYDGTIAWGSRNAIVCANSDNNTPWKYSIIKNAHKEKVSSLAFPPQSLELNDPLLASTGYDSTLNIWNLSTLSIAYEYSIENGKQLTGVSWSHKHPLLTYWVTTDGLVISWNVYSKSVSTISLGKVAATCISCCPHDPNLVAVGSKSGLLYIINFHGKARVLYSLRGHDTEVVDLSWCPVETNVISKNTSKDCLLASGGRDRSVFIWRAGKDGRCETEIKLPTGPLDSSQHRSKLNASNGQWIALCWIEPKLLLTSCLWGELVSWDLSQISNSKPVYKLIHACHSRGLFCISNVPSNVGIVSNDWRKRNSLVVWSLAQDRQIIRCCIKDNNVHLEYQIPTLGGHVYCMSPCPLDTSRIAFGVADMTLNIWNLSEPHDNSFDIIKFWQSVKGKVRAISWHPEKENLLAYGTGEGRVGVFDTNGKKPPILYKQYHRNTVYALGWGPNPQSDQYALYSCGEGELVLYNSEKLTEEPTSIMKEECTGFSWKPDFSCLAVGLANGSILFYNRDLVVCGKVNCDIKQKILCLAWHPQSTATDLTVSLMQNFLAVALDASTIIVLDTSNLINKLIDEKENPPESENIEKNCDFKNLPEIVATLNGHAEKVVCLAWSPHFSGYLVSGSYDSVVQVWKIETKELICTYTGHCAPVLCCMWSPLHPDFVITGSIDSTVRIWKIGNQVIKMPTPKTTKKSTSRKNMRNLARNINTMEEALDKQETTEKLKEESKKNGQRVSYFSKSAKFMNSKSMLLNSITDIVRNAHDHSACGDDGEITYCNRELPLFSKKEDFESFLTDEKSVHQLEGRFNIVTEMNMWNDNLKEDLETALKENRLNDFLVSLAPSLSMKMWKEISEAYADQLVAEGNPQKAVSYLLSIHKTYKAIQVFESAHLYKEAYALGRSKLDPGDPILNGVLESWADYCVETGQFEQAAQVFATLGNFSKTTKYLARRKDAATLTTAAEVAHLAGDDQFSLTLAEHTIDAYLMSLEYGMVENTIAKFPGVKYREVHLHVLKELKEHMQGRLNFDIVNTWLNGKSSFGLLQMSEKYNDCHSYYLNLRQNLRYNTTIDNQEMLWLKVSHDIAMAITCEAREMQLKHIAAALSTISQFETLHRNDSEHIGTYLIRVALLLDFKHPTDEGSIYEKTVSTVSNSLRAYLCLGLLNWLVFSVEEEVINQNAQTIVNILDSLVDDAINQAAVKYHSIANEMNKLESRLVSITALGNTKEDDSHEDQKNDATSIIEQMETLKSIKNELVESYVCIPSPMFVYGQVNEFISKLHDENIRNNFSKNVSKLWRDAIS